MTAQITTPLMRYHGGKFRLADWVISHFPQHECYIEPFGGAGSVLLQKPRSYAEVYNDLDGDIVNVFRVLRDPEQRQQLIEQLAMTPYARAEFELANEVDDELPPVERARRTLFRAQAGFGSAGATKGISGFRIDTRREYSLSSHLWAEYPEPLPTIATRLAGVLIENRSAIEVIQQHDGPDSLVYADPPYVFGTRFKAKSDGANGRYYRHEMTDDDHIDFLNVLIACQGYAIVSGYMTDLYHETLTAHGWGLRTKEARISAFRGTATRTECLWLNPRCLDAQAQMTLI